MSAYDLAGLVDILPVKRSDLIGDNQSTIGVFLSEPERSPAGLRRERAYRLVAALRVPVAPTGQRGSASAARWRSGVRNRIARVG